MAEVELLQPLVELPQSHRARLVEVEPLPADSPLWTREDVYVTPHVAALSRPDDVARVFAVNLDRYLRGEPLLYEVDWGKGY